MTEVDVAIVGGGLAGCAAALTLLHYTSLSVAVLERSRYCVARPGEHLSIESLPMLQYLGLDANALLADDVAGDIPACAWESADLRVERPRFGGAGRAWFVDRARLDRSLAGAAVARGAALCAASVRSVAFDGAARRWEIVADGVEGSVRVRARGLIDAGGSRSPVARRLGASFVMDDALYAVIARFRAASPPLRNLVVEAVADGWWYAVRVPGEALVVTFLTDLASMRRLQPGRTEIWLELAGATSHIARIVGGRTPLSLDTVFVPSRRIAQASGPSWIAAGDAAMTTDPISSMGIGFALHSGAGAARALLAELRGDDTASRVYAARVAATFDRYRAKRRAVYEAVSRWRHRPFWRRRTSPISV